MTRKIVEEILANAQISPPAKLNKLNLLLHDTSINASDRLWQLLNIRKQDNQDEFRKAVAIAGAELERLKPCPDVASPGTVVVVIADKEKVFSTYRCLPPGYALGDFVDAAAHLGRDWVTTRRPTWPTFDESGIADILEFIIEQFGSAPGHEGMQVEGHINWALCLLFMSMAKEKQIRLADALDRISINGVCPAMVGLVGDADRVRWPVLIGIAPDDDDDDDEEPPPADDPDRCAV